MRLDTVLVSDFIVERLVQLGVQHVFGVGGANIEDMFAAVQRRRPVIRALICKHEHAAGTAADAYTRLRGLGAVMVTSGGGAMNLVHALAEARASQVPLLAIVGEPPSPLQGKGAFQDTSGKGDAVDAQAVFQAAAGHCTRVAGAPDLPGALERALAATRGARRGPAVLLLAKELQTAAVSEVDAQSAAQPAAAPRAPDAAAVRSAHEWLRLRPIVIIAGAEVARARAQRELAELAELLDARVATAPDARDAFDNRDPRFLGVSGAMGHPGVARALVGAELVLVVGSALPLLARQGLEAILSAKRLLSLGSQRPLIASARSLVLEGELSLSLRALLATLGSTRRAPPSTPAPLLPPTAVAPEQVPLGSAGVLRAVDGSTRDGDVVLVDAGNTGASAVHHVRAPRGGHWLIAMGMAGMGYTFGAATGAALATGKRCIVIAGDGAFFMHGMEIHTAVEHALPITYVLLNNRAHGMCLVRERLLLGENAGYNAFSCRTHLGAGLAAMFPGLHAWDCETQAEVERALARASECTGPSVICAELREVEIPPFTPFQERAPSTTTVAREVDDGRSSTTPSD
jgi:acetolactate synthase-1/2/3 large subunit